MSSDQIAHHVDDANTTWIARSALTWTLDLTLLTAAGITLRRPQNADGRAAAATRALLQARHTDTIPEQHSPPEPPRVEPPQIEPRTAAAPPSWLRRLIRR